MRWPSGARFGSSHTIPWYLVPTHLTSQFASGLSALAGGQGLAIRPWGGSRRRSLHLLEVSTRPLPTLLYVKESTSPSGFWGVTKNQISKMQSAECRWFCVFLHLEPSRGYLLSGGQLMMRIESGTLTLSGDGDYKLNERQDFFPGQRFSTLSELAARVL